MLFLRQVRPWGGPVVDVTIVNGRIVELGVDLPESGMVIEGRGDILLPGLHDHHLHILALAARKHSVDLSGISNEADVRAALAEAPLGPSVRAVDYDERAAGIPDRLMLDDWISDRPLRLADRTGALRVLNSAALELLCGKDLPNGAELDSNGKPTGRFWREDQWLAGALPSAPPLLSEVGSDLAAMGLTSLTDAGAGNGPEEAVMLAGAIPQRLTMMGSEALGPGKNYELGALKLLIDERDPPAPEDLAERIVWARKAERPVAAHCVTEGELAIYIAALEIAGGTQPGDRIEHGGVIPRSFLPVIARTSLKVVTNPTFIHDRGDRYRETFPEDRWCELYPNASLAKAGIEVLAGSDAPYANVDPWLGMRSARDRLTEAGIQIGAEERVTALSALRLYCSGKIGPGDHADLIICSGTLADILTDLSKDRVRVAMIGGEVAFNRDGVA